MGQRTGLPHSRLGWRFLRAVLFIQMKCPRCLRGSLLNDLDGLTCICCAYSPPGEDALPYAGREIPHNIREPMLRGERAMEGRRKAEREYRQRRREQIREARARIRE